MGSSLETIVSTVRQPKWVREETVLLVSEYYRSKNKPKSEQQRSIEIITKILRIRAEKKGISIDKHYRNIDGITMKFGNMQALDQQIIDSGRSGLRHVSSLENEIVKEYVTSPEKINQKAYLMVMRYLEM